MYPYCKPCLNHGAQGERVVTSHQALAVKMDVIVTKRQSRLNSSDCLVVLVFLTILSVQYKVLVLLSGKPAIRF